MNKIIYSFFVFVFISSSVYAQGYQGKRFTLVYQSSHSFIGQFNWKKNYLLHRHSANVSFAVSRNLSLQVGLNYAKKTMPANYSLMSLGNSSILGYTRQFVRFNNATILDRTISINLKHFPKNNGSIAPIGTFMGFGFEFGTQNGISFHSVVDDQVLLKYDADNQQNLFVVNFTSGRNMIYNDRWIVGYGVIVGAGLTRRQQFTRHFLRTYFELGFIF